ncbi:MAG: hypothetical protein ACREMV_00030 [Gemmatimonadales bacterium]
MPAQGPSAAFGPDTFAQGSLPRRTLVEIRLAGIIKRFYADNAVWDATRRGQLAYRYGPGGIMDAATFQCVGTVVVVFESGFYLPCSLAVVNPTLWLQLQELRSAWLAANPGIPETQLWQLNVIYRNPAHNRFHVPGADRNSFHVDGCAADLQTFDIGRANRRLFFNRLNNIARAQGFDYEQIGQLGGDANDPNHVHVELDPCPIVRIER